MTPTWWAGVAVLCAIIAMSAQSHTLQLVALSVGSVLALRFVEETDAD